MPNAQTEDLSDLDSMWADAKEPEFNDYSDLVGSHILRIDRCAVETSRNSKRMLVWEWSIVTPPHVGREYVDRNMLESAQNLGWLKVRLRQVGVGVDAPDFQIGPFLETGRGVVIGKLVRGRIFEGKPSDQGQRNFNLALEGGPRTLGSAVATDADVAAWNPAKAGGTAPAGAVNNEPAAAGAASPGNPWNPQ